MFGSRWIKQVARIVMKVLRRMMYWSLNVLQPPQRYLFYDLKTRTTEDLCPDAYYAKESTGLRVVCISDTHGWHETLDLPECDILVHCGDICTVDGGNEMPEFKEWLCRQKATHKVVIGGNHDSMLKEIYKTAEESDAQGGDRWQS
eukprot:TRINITY_DN678_c0_g1_i7.p1 TRINITY_DN678_c0_g1~~TRINITY_DN678_c0_g1_i7.p1  ORF type:complete len:146 (+),score=23.54 TRINITY_DN678_c0_g1_i7:49-486(+)